MRSLLFFNPSTQRLLYKNQILAFSPYLFFKERALSLPPPTPTHISFEQKPLSNIVKNNPYLFKDLFQIDQQFQGLCEIICNYVIMNNLLGPWSNKSFDQINLAALNKPKVKRSHILNNSSFLEKLNAFFRDVYPYDLFGNAPDLVQNNKVNETLLADKLNSIENGAYIKLFVVSKSGLSFKGHSMLIKKTGNNYSFFDPNHGEDTQLTVPELGNKINNVYAKFNGTNLIFINGDQYIASLQHAENPTRQNTYLNR